MIDQAVRKQLVKHLHGGEAFVPVSKMLQEIPFHQLGERPKDLPYSFYELFYHIMYTQKDILEFCVSTNYKTSDWPNEYWPEHKQPKSEEDWETLQHEYTSNLKSLTAFIEDTSNSLTQPVKNGKDEQTLLRESLLVVEHTAYHTGQLLVVLRCLGLHTS
ncbi:DinB family protein [Mesonia sp. MT50]|uniref:DinB family protein n=1 Tax=Mesonia profundi TaxID=3070998 RepID=A0ABU1A4E4_9FLAO|nr:DinB family protein [Mesonia profundi]MDQ7918572.1 DinB family protein [Mesonia profundi]